MGAPVGNKYAIGNNGGAPRLYKSTEELIIACDEYFEYIKGEGHDEKLDPTDESSPTTWVWDRVPEPPTVTGLALYLGFDSRQSLYDYGKKDEFSYVIKKAKLIVEHGYEKGLGGDKPTGAIFALKNMGWEDRQKQEVSGALTNLNVEVTPEDAETIKKALDNEY